jgi:hypothetical protein
MEQFKEMVRRHIDINAKQTDGGGVDEFNKAKGKAAIRCLEALPFDRDSFTILKGLKDLKAEDFGIVHVSISSVYDKIDRMVKWYYSNASKAGSKIDSIKDIRSTYKLDLKQAKDIVESHPLYRNQT